MAGLKNIDKLADNKISENEPMIRFYIPRDYSNPKINKVYRVYINCQGYKIIRGKVVTLPEHIFKEVARHFERQGDAEEVGSELVLVE